MGSSGLVSICAADPCFVLKGYQVWHDGHRTHSFEPFDDCKASLEVEREVCQRLGSHEAILGYAGQEEVAGGVYSLKLERAKGGLRSIISVYPAPPEQACLAMGIRMAAGMTYMHSKGVFHCDFSCRNVFALDDWVPKIGDFGGSKIDGRKSVGAEEIRYELPLRGRTWEQRDYVARERFALGCAVYEVTAWKVPFAGLSDREVEERYAGEEFPDVEVMLAGDIIRRCWEEGFQSAEDVVVALEASRRSMPREVLD